MRLPLHRIRGKRGDGLEYPREKSIQQSELKFEILKMCQWGGTIMEALHLPKDLEVVNDC